MIRIAGSVSKSWLARELGVAFEHDYYFDPVRRHAVDRQCNEYVSQTLGDLEVFYTESNLGRAEWYDLDQVLIGGIQPNLIVGMLLGATFIAAPDADADITSRCLEGRDLARLPDPVALAGHPLIRQWDDQLRWLSGAGGPGWRGIPPFFWDTSGRAAVHGAVTSGLKFLGDEFLLNMVAEPDACQGVIQWLTEVSAELVNHFSTVGTLPVREIHVGECAACMLDVDNFCRFVVPATSALGDRFGAVRFHSCGRSDHLITSCRAIRNLASLDVGGETSVGRIRSVFGERFPIGIAPLVEDMRANSEEGILRWFDRVACENAGGDLTIGFHLEATFSLQAIRALHEAVRRVGNP
ncbi:MAG: hypothetical protein ACYC0X_29005 [Pirellulaceae bacterium]